jgi:hypothetical protein
MGWQQQRSTDLVMSHVLHFCSQHVSLTLCLVTDLRFWGGRGKILNGPLV